MPSRAEKPIDELDRLRTIKEAAELLGIKVHKLRRAIRTRQLKYYTLIDGRRYVTLRDIGRLIQASA